MDLLRRQLLLPGASAQNVHVFQKGIIEVVELLQARQAF